MTDNKTVEGRRLAFVAAREASGLTQEQAAKRLGMSVASVSRKERGDQPVSSADVLAMEALRSSANQSSELGAATDQTLPADLRRRATQFMVAMGLHGATEEELAHVDAMIFAPHVITLIQSKGPREADEEFQMHLSAARRWLQLRMARRGADLPDELSPLQRATGEASDTPMSPKRERVEPDEKKGRRRA